MASEKLSSRHNKIIKDFYCGNSYLDNFLKNGSAFDKAIGRTYIYTTADSSEIIGYYNISTGSLQNIESTDVKFKMGGSIHINAFAISQDYQGKTVGDHGFRYSDIVLSDCIERIEKLRDSVGFAFITLASTSMGYNLYKRHGFEELEPDMVFTLEHSEVDCIQMYYALDYE